MHMLENVRELHSRAIDRAFQKERPQIEYLTKLLRKGKLKYKEYNERMTAIEEVYYKMLTDEIKSYYE